MGSENGQGLRAAHAAGQGQERLRGLQGGLKKRVIALGAFQHIPKACPQGLVTLPKRPQLAGDEGRGPGHLVGELQLVQQLGLPLKKVWVGLKKGHHGSFRHSRTCPS